MSAAKVARGTVYITVQNILTAAMGIVFYIVAARVLTPSDIGVIAALQFAIAIYTTISILSLQTAATKYMSEEIGRRRPEVAAEIVVLTLKIVAVSSILILCLAYLSSPLLAAKLLGDPSKSLLFAITFLSAFFGVLRQMYASFFQGVQRLGLFAIANIVTVLVSSGLAVLAVMLGYGLAGVVISWLASQVVGFALSVFFYRGCLPRAGMSGYPASRLFRFAFPLLLLGLFGLVTSWSDRMVFLALSGRLADLGIYDLAVRGSLTLSVIPYAVGIAVLPAFSELYGRSGKEGMSRATKISTRYLAYLIFPAAIGLAAISETSLAFLFGKGYSLAGLPLTILSVAYIMTAYNVVFMTALQAIGETGVFVKIAVATMVVQTSLVIVLSPSLGMLGPTLARTAMQVVGFAYPLYVLRRRIDVEIDTKAAGGAALASCLMALPISLVDGMLKGLLVTSYRFVLDVFLGVLLYSIFVILLRLLEKNDLELLRQVVPREAGSILDLLERFLPDK